MPLELVKNVSGAGPKVVEKSKKEMEGEEEEEGKELGRERGKRNEGK